MLLLLGLALIWGTGTFFGMLTGCLIALVASTYPLLRFFRPYRAQQPGAVLANMVMAEVSKLILVGALFALAFKGIPWLPPLPTFLGFIVIYFLAFVGSGSTRKQATNQS